jgi:hypothetical protein
VVDVTVTSTGLDALYAATRDLNTRMTTRLQAVAAASAFRVKTRAQQLLRSQTHGTGATANAIGIVEDARRKRYQVVSQAPPHKPDLLPIWIEYGTSRQPARPYMRPAADAEEETYVRNMSDVAIDVMRGALG